jgi:hypothetical protein
LELRHAKKWQVEQTQLAEVDLVVEFDSTQPRGCWKLAIVEQIHPSDDTSVSEVTIHNNKGEGKTMSLLSATFCRLRQQKLVGSWEDFCFLRGECTKLGEGDT